MNWLMRSGRMPFKTSKLILQQVETLPTNHLMIPFLTAHQVIKVGKTPYEMFKEIDRLDLSEKLLEANAFNLVAVLEKTDPLAYSFKNDTDFFGRKNAFKISTLVLATFLPDQNGSDVFLTAKTNPMLYITGILMLLGLMINLVNDGPVASNILFVAILSSLIPIDLYSRKDLLKRTISVITQND